MRSLIAASMAMMTLLVGGMAAHAQIMKEGDYYVIEDSSGNKRIVGGGNSEGTPVMMHSGGNEPANCATGAYWMNASGDLLACGGAASFALVAPEAGAMMSDGKAYPSGAMVMKQR